MLIAFDRRPSTILSESEQPTWHYVPYRCEVISRHPKCMPPEKSKQTNTWQFCDAFSPSITSENSVSSVFVFGSYLNVVFFAVHLPSWANGNRCANYSDTFHRFRWLAKSLHSWPRFYLHGIKCKPKIFLCLHEKQLNENQKKIRIWKHLVENWVHGNAIRMFKCVFHFAPIRMAMNHLPS